MDFFEHGGNKDRSIYEYDFSANINPLGMPECTKELLKASVEDNEYYPEEYASELRGRLAEQYSEKFNIGLSNKNIICANGASELIYAVVRALKPAAGVVTAPAFSEYERALNSIGAEVIPFYLRKEEFAVTDEIIGFLDNVDSKSLLFLCNPNNPTGGCIEAGLFKRILSKCRQKEIYVVTDECFLMFSSDYKEKSAINCIDEFRNLFVINAFTKVYAMPGLRLGYGICKNKEIIEKIYRQIPAWNVSAMAQKAGISALSDKCYISDTVEYVEKERSYLIREMAELKNIIYKIYEPHANYIFIKAYEELDKMLRENKIAIRSCENYRGLGKGYFRIAVRTHAENEVLISILKQQNKAELKAKYDLGHDL